MLPKNVRPKQLMQERVGAAVAVYHEKLVRSPVRRSFPDTRCVRGAALSWFRSCQSFVSSQAGGCTRAVRVVTVCEGVLWEVGTRC